MKLHWPRTMQLQPAHLHARDAYVEGLLTARSVRRIPNAYGFVELDMDLAAGAEGNVVVRRLDAVFPSGAVVQVEPAAPLRRAVHGAGESFDAFVALPRAVLRGPNVALEGDPARSTRFLAAQRKDPRHLPLMRANPEILLEGEASDGFEVLRLGRLRRVGKSLRVEERSFPTAVRLGASRALGEGLKGVIEACEARQRELVRYRADHPLRLGAVIASELPGLQLSVILQRYLPLLNDCAAHRGAHPHRVYGLLCALHGAPTGFGASEIGPSYDHDDQARVFPWLFDRIKRLALETARDRTTVLPFERVDDVTFRLAFGRGDLAGKRPMLVLRGGEESFLRERVPSLLKMASPTGITPLLHSALRGAAVAVEFEPPDVIPRQEGVVAYRIDVRDPHWLDIEDRTAVQLHLSGAPKNLEAALYGVERVV